MKTSAHLQNQIINALSQSMNVDLMQSLAGRVIPDYDLHERSGFPATIAIPQVTAARQITQDMRREDLMMRFIEVLIDVDRNGIMGRSISIRLLSQIINEIESFGFLFNEDFGIFVESEQRVKTKSWGILREGMIYEFSFLSLDIVRSSELVRKYPKTAILKTYRDLKKMVTRIVEKRDGRIWNWEGDGGLAAFYFANKNVQAALTGMEILLELFMYNLFDCPLKNPVNVRIAVHTGPCHFLNNIKEIQSDTLRRIKLIESKYTESNSLMISPGVYSDMGTKLENFFQPLEISKQNFLYNYKLGWE